MYRPDNPTCQNVSPIYSLTKCKIAAFTHLVYEGIETFDGFIGRENLPNWKSNLLVEKNRHMRGSGTYIHVHTLFINNSMTY